MTQRYNTGNPRPSNSMKDVNDNALANDDYMNSEADTFIDRTGDERDTLRGANKKMLAAGAAVVEETRQNLIPLSRQYMTQAAAQADIANIPVGSTTYYRSPDDNSLAIEIMNVGGTLTATGRKMPSQSHVDTLLPDAGLTTSQDIYDDEGILLVHALADAEGRAPLTINQRGAVGLANAQIESAPANAEAHWGITDNNGVPYIYGTPMGGVGVGNTEIVEIPGPPGIVFCDANYIPMACTPGFESDQDIPVIGGSGTSETVTPVRLSDWVGVRSHGQSLSLGQIPASSAATNPPVSTTQPYGNVGFSTNNNSFTSDTDTVIPLIERAYTPENSVNPVCESPCSGASNGLVERLVAERGLTWDALGTVVFSSSPGRGGTPISGLSKGTTHYQRALDHVTNSVRLANSAGKTFSELAILWTQGENNYGAGTGREDYLSQLRQYISDITADTIEITGQSYPPMFISYQLGTHRQYSRDVPTVALALRDAALDGISRLSHPMYSGSYLDGVHCTNNTYLMFAKYYGRTVYKLLKDNQSGNKPGMHWLDKIGEYRQGNIVELYFNVPTPPLVIDTDWVLETVNYGFDIRDAANNYAVSDIITSVSISGQNKVRIICSRPLTGTEQVTYAWGRPGDVAETGRKLGPRGNLRDSEGDLPGESYTDSAGTLRKLHNWCVIF